MNDSELSTHKLTENWTFVTWVIGQLFPTRIIQHKRISSIGTYTYKIQKWYLFFWKDVCIFSGKNIGG
jgi:hypothetical protein